jgi:hypothetical protein
MRVGPALRAIRAVVTALLRSAKVPARRRSGNPSRYHSISAFIGEGWDFDMARGLFDEVPA